MDNEEPSHTFSRKSSKSECKAQMMKENFVFRKDILKDYFFFFLKFKNSHVMSLSQKNLRKVTVGNTPDQKQFKINSKQIIINTFLND